MTLRIGPYSFANAIALAPMAGVTDRPFRQLCRAHGAGLVFSEMVTADSRLWHTRKSRLRMDHRGEPGPRIVQIAGGDPAMLAEAARKNVELGADIIDINMGCPAKKVCNKAAGSALLRDEALVAAILTAVVAAVDVPVTLKMRTGWSPDERNALTIARIAEDAGIQALSIHGRTRACAYQGQAEYDTIAAVVAAVRLPVIANGDINTPEQARQVLRATGASGVMVGRGAQGRPWIFREIDHFLRTGRHLPPPSQAEVHRILSGHLHSLHQFYGPEHGARIARKHVGWYLQTLTRNEALLPTVKTFRQHFNRLDAAEQQHAALRSFFAQMNNEEQAA